MKAAPSPSLVLGMPRCRTGRPAHALADDARIKPSVTLGQHVYLEAEVPAAADQVAERAGPEFILVTVTASSTINAGRLGLACPRPGKPGGPAKIAPRSRSSDV